MNNNLDENEFLNELLNQWLLESQTALFNLENNINNINNNNGFYISLVNIILQTQIILLINKNNFSLLDAKERIERVKPFEKRYRNNISYLLKKNIQTNKDTEYANIKALKLKTKKILKYFYN